MPAPKKQGRRRLEIVAEPEWLDKVAEAARRADRSVSSYVRTATNVQMEKDGIEPSPLIAKPRGRKNKGKRPL